MEDEDLRRLFRKLGISKIPEEGDGYDEVKQRHEFHSTFRFRGAGDATQGPLQSMMNSVEFRMNFGESLATPELPYLFFDRELTVRDNTWNAEGLVQQLKKLIVDRGDTAEEGFYTTVSYARHGGKTKLADVHWVGLEFRRGVDADRLIVYDPGRGGGGPATWQGADPIQYGLLIALLSDPEVSKTLGWDLVPDPWGDFGSRDETLAKAADMAIFDRTNRARDVKLGTVLRKLGVRLFNPKTTPCQVDTSDYFCQTWVLFLFGERSKGKSVEKIEESIEALCDDKEGIKQTILEFARSALESDVAMKYWTARRFRRGSSTKGRAVYTEGRDFYAWLRFVVSRPEFGEDFLGDACFANVTLRRGGADPTEGGIELL